VIERTLIAGISKCQRDPIEWAAAAMIDFWLDEEERAEEGAQVVQNPVQVFKHRVEIVLYRPVLEDLKYRLLIQYPDVCEEEKNRAALVRAAKEAWKRIAAAIAIHGLTDIRVPLFETVPGPDPIAAQIVAKMYDDDERGIARDQREGN
jgi:hypothetical protein